MFRKLSLGFAVALVALALAATAYAHLQTTGPGHIDTVRVAMRDTGVSISKGTFLRGDTSRFIATNKGTKLYRLKVGVDATPLLRPGKTAIILVQWDTRGTFPLFQQGVGGKPVSRVSIRIT